MDLCPYCQQPFLNLGNTSGKVYTTFPPQEDHTLVCDDCQVFATKRVQQDLELQDRRRRYNYLGPLS